VTSVAITHAATRRSLRRRQLLAVLPALGAVLLLAVAGSVARHESRSRQLQRDGVQAPANVTAIDSRSVGRSRQPDGSITVRFDVEGDPHEATIDVGDAVAGFQIGQQATVVYDADDPSHVEVLGLGAGRRGIPLWAPLLGAGVLAVMAAVAGRRAWRIGRVVRSAPWRPVPARLVEVAYTVGFRERARLVLALDAPSGRMVVAPSGLGRIDPSFVPETWLAGVGGRRQVIAAPGGGHVLAVDVVTPRERPPTSRP
jgi:uncharacterized protein DUF3592